MATCTGRVSGLGTGDVQVVVSFPNATASTLCHAPGGGNTAPGQNPAAHVTVTGTQFINEPKNGSLRFSVTTAVPSTPSAADAGCPNNNWTVTIEDVTFGSGTLRIYQLDANGTPVLVIGPTAVSA